MSSIVSEPEVLSVIAQQMLDITSNLVTTRNLTVMEFDGAHKIKLNAQLRCLRHHESWIRRSLPNFPTT